MSYVDGFVLTVPRKKVGAYKKIASKACKIWLEYGALDYRECVGDDLNVQWGIPFTKIAKPKAGETVVFAWIVYKNKADRNRINKLVMKDKRLSCDPANLPFDCKRMTYGGFKTLVASK